MNRRTLLQILSVAGILPAAVKTSAEPASDSVFELRIYHAAEGKLPDLLKRFREHTTKLFDKHGLKNVAYWTPTDDPAKSNTLIYFLAHPSREAASANWKAFQADPEWIEVKEKSEANGKLVDKVDSTFMTKTDFSNFNFSL